MSAAQEASDDLKEDNSMNSKHAKELLRLKRIAKDTSIETCKRFGLSEEDVMVLCKYLTGSFYHQCQDFILFRCLL